MKKSVSLLFILSTLTACVASIATPLPTMPSTMLVIPTPGPTTTIPVSKSASLPLPLVPIELPQMEWASAWQLPNADIWQIAYSPSGDYLAITSSLGVLIYETDTLSLRGRLPGDTEILTASWSPNEEQIATGTKNGKIGIWNWAEEQELTSIAASSYGISSVAWSDDGDYLASLMGEGAQIWDISSREKEAVFSDKTVYSLAWSPSGDQLAGGALNATVKVWSTTTWEKLADLHGTGGHESQSFWTVTMLSWSPNEKWLAGGLEEGTILVWDQSTGNLSATMTGSTQVPNSLAWSPNSKLLASSASDWVGRVWDVSTGSELIAFDKLGKVVSMTWSPDGKYLTMGTMEDILIMLDVSKLPL